MHESFRLGRILGIRIGAHWTVLGIAGMVAWVLASQILPEAVPGRPVPEYWAAGIAAALLFFVSLLAHELAHAVVAKREGLEVEGITLWLLGGVAQLRGEARSPGAEARIAGVGPLVSVVLGVVAAIVAWGALTVGLPPLVVAGAAWLAGVNIVLGLFNLLPGAPLDGGRILRAIVWRTRGDALRATRVATTVGRLLGFGLIAFGIGELVLGADASGIWTMVLGFFLVNAAGIESTQAVLVNALQGLRVRAVMDGGLLRVPGGLRLDTFTGQLAQAQRASAYLVAGPGGEVRGIVVLGQVARVPAGERAGKRLEEIALPLAAVPSAGPDELLTDVLARQQQGSPGVLVIEGGVPVGFVGRREIEEAIEKARLIGRGGAASGPAGRPSDAAPHA
ncbi:MAG: site-2 protease family protein [Chloroflexota bacterium]